MSKNISFQTENEEINYESRILNNEEIQDILVRIKGHCAALNEKYKSKRCEVCSLCHHTIDNSEGCILSNQEFSDEPKDWKINYLGKPQIHKFF